MSNAIIALCLPVMSLDFAHLHGEYALGVIIFSMLTTFNQYMPIAAAIVYAETAQAYADFMTIVFNVYPALRQFASMCIISDRHKRLESELLRAVFVSIYGESFCHVICVLHLVGNVYVCVFSFPTKD